MKVLKMTMTTLLLYWSKAALPHCRELLVDLLLDLRREGKLRDRQRLVAELKKWIERQDGAPPVDNRLPTSWQSCIRE
jgi:hypothetical protein